MTVEGVERRGPRRVLRVSGDAGTLEVPATGDTSPRSHIEVWFDPSVLWPFPDATPRVQLSPTGSGWAVQLDDGSAAGFDRILVAVGRRPNTSDLGLDLVGVETDDRSHVAVDDLLRTTDDHIYAAGDVTGKMPFTHVAAHQARLVVTNAMLRTRRRAAYDHIPWVTFTDPEIARVGLDAAAAGERWGDRAVVQRYDYANLDRAVTQADNRGWAELVGDPKRRLVGATVVGSAAGESIAELTAWIVNGARIDDVSTTVHAYPTLAEGPSRAADDVLRARYFDPRLPSSPQGCWLCCAGSTDPAGHDHDLRPLRSLRHRCGGGAAAGRADTTGHARTVHA
jgi:hypothetical protein